MYVSLRYDYSQIERSENDYIFVDYGTINDIANKKMLIYVQYYDEKHDNHSYFDGEFITSDHIQHVEWLIINDCNIPSSTKILEGNNQFNNLIGLDLSFNNICDFGSIEDMIRNSPKLQYLDLSHNPIEFQTNLQEIILKKNPAISVINRKRVTPNDFYNIYFKNPNFNEKEKKNFFLCQIKAAIRTIEKDRIYPSEAEIIEFQNLHLNDYNLRSNYIDTSKIQAIDLSKCNLIYFDFSLFPNAFFIDISNNRIEQVDYAKDPNINLLYLNISNNDYKDQDTLTRKFPECKIYPFVNKVHYLKNPENPENPENDNTENRYHTLNNLINDMQVVLLSLPTRQEVNKIQIYAKEGLRNIVKFVNSKKDDQRDTYSISSNSIGNTLKNANDKLHINEEIIIEFNEVDDDYPFKHSNSYLYYPLYFIAYLNLKNFSIRSEDFDILVARCNQLQQLIVRFENINNSEKSVNEIYFKDFHKNNWPRLTDLEIYFDDYSFNTTKKYNKFIKQIGQIPHLKNFTIAGYTTEYSLNDEIDNTFKFLRGLDTFNGYRNLIPPTPAQYLALRASLPNINDNKNNETFNDNNNVGRKQYQNLNNLQFLYLYESDLQDSTSQAIKWSKALPVRRIKIAGLKDEDVKNVVNQNSKFFDKYFRLKYVNGMKIKKELKARDREESQNENLTFESWTSKIDKLFEIISQIQFFVLYSVKSSSSFVSKLLYFIYTLFIVFERFFIGNNIKISTDFTSSFEKIFLLTITPIFILGFLFWDPSYKTYIKIATEPYIVYSILGSFAAVGMVFLIGLSIVDSKFEHEVVCFPYLLQFIILIWILVLILCYYRKKIYIMKSRNSEMINHKKQEKTIFHSYLEFKYFKSKVAYSCLIILIIPVCGLLFNSKLSFTFVDTYKVLFTSIIILFITTLLFVKTNEQSSKIVEYLGLNENSKEKKKEKADSKNQYQDDDQNRTHYFVMNPKDKNKKSCFNIKIFDGAFQYKHTAEDDTYKEFVAGFRTPTQIFYSTYRYRGLQRFYGLIEIIQRILTEIISEFFIRWLFIVPLFFTVYVAVWWPQNDNVINLCTLLSSFGKVLMNLFNFLFSYFGYDDNKVIQSILTYMNFCGIVFNIFGIGLLAFYTIYELIKIEKKDKSFLFHDSMSGSSLNLHLNEFHDAI